MRSSRARHEEAEEGHDRWLVSYADFMTLLFAFFAVLYATSQKDVQKSKEFQVSIKKYLIKAGGAMGGGAVADMNQGERHSQVIDAPIPSFRPEKAESVTGLDQAETFIEEHLTKDERQKYIMDIAADEWGVRITLKSELIFDGASDKFRAEAVPFISKLSALLTQSGRKVLIEGHVGKGEVGTYHSTWDFASARAVNMLRFMQKKEGLKPERLAAASFADSRPLFEGPQSNLNSRLEVVLLNEDTNL